MINNLSRCSFSQDSFSLADATKSCAFQVEMQHSSKCWFYSVTILDLSPLVTVTFNAIRFANCGGVICSRAYVCFRSIISASADFGRQYLSKIYRDTEKRENRRETGNNYTLQ